MYCCERDPVSHNCYVISKSSMSYDQALEYCSKKNLTLLEIVNSNQNEFIRKLLARGRHKRAWLAAKQGLFYDYKWNSSNSYITWSNFAVFEPNCRLNCCALSVDQSGFWFDVDCAIQLNVVCQGPSPGFIVKALLTDLSLFVSETVPTLSPIVETAMNVTDFVNSVNVTQEVYNFKEQLFATIDSLLRPLLMPLMVIIIFSIVFPLIAICLIYVKMCNYLKTVRHMQRV